jgi:hypothetical protein
MVFSPYKEVLNSGRFKRTYLENLNLLTVLLNVSARSSAAELKV